MSVFTEFESLEDGKIVQKFLVDNGSLDFGIELQPFDIEFWDVNDCDSDKFDVGRWFAVTFFWRYLQHIIMACVDKSSFYDVSVKIGDKTGMWLNCLVNRMNFVHLQSLYHSDIVDCKSMLSLMDNYKHDSFLIYVPFLKRLSVSENITILVSMINVAKRLFFVNVDVCPSLPFIGSHNKIWKNCPVRMILDVGKTVSAVDVYVLDYECRISSFLLDVKVSESVCVWQLRNQMLFVDPFRCTVIKYPGVSNNQLVKYLNFSAATCCKGEIFFKESSRKSLFNRFIDVGYSWRSDMVSISRWFICLMMLTTVESYSWLNLTQIREDYEMERARKWFESRMFTGEWADSFYGDCSIVWWHCFDVIFTWLVIVLTWIVIASIFALCQDLVKGSIWLFLKLIFKMIYIPLSFILNKVMKWWMWFHGLVATDGLVVKEMSNKNTFIPHLDASGNEYFHFSVQEGVDVGIYKVVIPRAENKVPIQQASVAIEAPKDKDLTVEIVGDLQKQLMDMKKDLVERDLRLADSTFQLGNVIHDQLVDFKKSLAEIKEEELSVAQFQVSDKTVKPLAYSNGREAFYPNNLVFEGKNVATLRSELPIHSQGILHGFAIKIHQFGKISVFITPYHVASIIAVRNDRDVYIGDDRNCVCLNEVMTFSFFELDLTFIFVEGFTMLPKANPEAPVMGRSVFTRDALRSALAIDIPVRVQQANAVAFAGCACELLLCDTNTIKGNSGCGIYTNNDKLVGIHLGSDDFSVDGEVVQLSYVLNIKAVAVAWEKIKGTLCRDGREAADAYMPFAQEFLEKMQRDYLGNTLLFNFLPCTIESPKNMKGDSTSDKPLKNKILVPKLPDLSEQSWKDMVEADKDNTEWGAVAPILQDSRGYTVSIKQAKENVANYLNNVKAYVETFTAQKGNPVTERRFGFKLNIPLTRNQQNMIRKNMLKDPASFLPGLRNADINVEVPKGIEPTFDLGKDLGRTQFMEGKSVSENFVDNMSHVTGSEHDRYLQQLRKKNRSSVKDGVKGTGTKNGSRNNKNNRGQGKELAFFLSQQRDDSDYLAGSRFGGNDTESAKESNDFFRFAKLVTNTGKKRDEVVSDGFNQDGSTKFCFPGYVWPDLGHNSVKRSFTWHVGEAFEAATLDKRKEVDDEILELISAPYKKLKGTAQIVSLKEIPTFEAFKKDMISFLSSSDFTNIASSSVGTVIPELRSSSKGHMVGRKVNIVNGESIIVWDERKRDFAIGEMYKLLSLIVKPTESSKTMPAVSEKVVEIAVFGKDEPHVERKKDTIRLIANYPGTWSILGAYLFKNLKNCRVPSVTLAGFDLDHNSVGEYCAESFGSEDHSTPGDFDVKHLDWSTTKLDLEIVSCFYNKVFGKDSVQCKFYRAITGLNPDWKVWWCLPNGEVYELLVSAVMGSGRFDTLFANSVLMKYIFTKMLKDLGSNVWKSLKKDQKVAILEMFTLVGDDGIYNRKLFEKFKFTLAEMKTYWLSCGKYLKVDEDKSFCSRELRFINKLDLKNPYYDSQDHEQNRACGDGPSLPFPDIRVKDRCFSPANVMADKDSAFNILQNVKPQKSIMKLIPHKEKVTWNEAIVSFWINFAFYDMYGSHSDDNLEELFKQANLPWVYDTYSQLRSKAFYQRLFATPAGVVAVEDVENFDKHVGFKRVSFK